MCTVLGVARSTYYKFSDKTKSAREVDNDKLKAAILRIYKANKGIYGAPRIHKVLSIESFHSSIKKEEIYRNKYRTFEEANIAIFKYIEGWYNRRRLHSSINYMTPEQCGLLARSTA